MKKTILDQIKVKDKIIFNDNTQFILSGDGNLYKDDAKILDTDNASFADLQDVNIPTEITQSDNGKVIESYYASPDVYGDESDGELVISVPTQINAYTDMVADAFAGSQTLIVRDASSFTIGMTIMIHRTQGYRDINNVFKYEYNKIQNIVGNTISLETGLASDFLSDSDGNKANNTKTQIISVPQYSTLTVNANITCKVWDGYSGGIITFRAKNLEGTADIVATGCGYRAYWSRRGNWGTQYCMSESQYGGFRMSQGEDFLYSGEGYAYGYSSSSYSDTYYGGGCLISGIRGPNTPTTGFPGQSYSFSDFEQRVAFGGAGINAATNNYSPSPDLVADRGQTGGIIVSYVENHTLFSGKLYSSGLSRNGNYGLVSGGMILFYTEIAKTTDLIASGSTSYYCTSSDGIVYSGQSAVPPIRYYQLGPKVSTTLDNTSDLEIPTSKAVADYILSGSVSNASYITTIIPSSTSAFIDLDSSEAQYFLLSANTNFYIENTEVGKAKHVVTQIYSTGSYDAIFDSNWIWIGQAPDNDTYESVNGDKITLDILAFNNDIYAALGLPTNAINRLAVNTIEVSAYTILSSDMQKMLDITYNGDVTIYAPSGVFQQYDELVLNRITSGNVNINAIDTYLNNIFEGETSISDQYAMVTLRCYEEDYLQIIGNFAAIS